MTVMGAHWIFVLPMAFLAGIVMGYIYYHLIIRHIYSKENFSVNIIIASVALAALGENAYLNLAGGEALRQPFRFNGGLEMIGVVLTFQTIFTVFIAVLLMIILTLIMSKTKLGQVIRAVSQQPTASKLMGINVQKSFATALMLYGSIAAISGVLVTGTSQIFPSVGYDSTVKALVILIVAGLGNLRAGIFMAFALGFLEMGVNYVLGARYGFPSMLAFVIIVLLFKPNGFFGKEQITRV
jgi:branched-chain amino acid transport system permease protein